MAAPDDAFLRWLTSLSGQTIDFIPGTAGFDDALTSLAFLDLCARHGVTCGPPTDAARPEGGTVVVGSTAAALRHRDRLAGRRTVVLPGSIARFEDLGDGFDPETTAFWRDGRSRQMAILQGMAPGRALQCHDLAVHLDVTPFPSGSVEREGSLTLDVGEGRPAIPGDRILVQLDGRDDRWASPHQCRDAVSRVAERIAGVAEIRTDSPGLAILAARLGRSVRLNPGPDGSNAAAFDDTIAPLFPAVSLDPGEAGAGGQEGGAARDGAPTPHPSEGDVGRLKALLATARREAQHLAQERDRLFVAVADLGERGDAETVAIVRSHRDARERAEAEERAATGRLAASEARAAAARSEAEEARRILQDRLTAAEDACEAAKSDAAAREAAAAESAAAREAAAAAREAALGHRLAELDAAFDARTRQALALQSALDERDARAVATEGRIARMRALIDARTASGDEARREAEAARRRLDELASSASWRVTRPLRDLARAVGRLTGVGAGGHRG